jgi:adenylate cyclase
LERKLTAILCADVFGYSRLMGEDEEATLRTLSSNRKLIDSLIEQHHGRFVNSAGDSVLAEFASVVNAVQCAVEIQSTLKTENAKIPPDRRMEFRVGVNSGDVIVDGEQIYGDGVNVAARLESLAEPGGIYISRTVHEQIRNKLALNYEACGTGAHRRVIVFVQHLSLCPPAPSASIPSVQIPRAGWASRRFRNTTKLAARFQRGRRTEDARSASKVRRRNFLRMLNAADAT